MNYLQDKPLTKPAADPETTARRAMADKQLDLVNKLDRLRTDRNAEAYLIAKGEIAAGLRQIAAAVWRGDYKG